MENLFLSEVVSISAALRRPRAAVATVQDLPLQALE
jgi:hypothetical protein